MKTMKLWRNILVMTAAMLSFASCSSDDDEDFFTIGTDGIPMPATYHSTVGKKQKCTGLTMMAPLKKKIMDGICLVGVVPLITNLETKRLSTMLKTQVSPPMSITR